MAEFIRGLPHDDSKLDLEKARKEQIASEWSAVARIIPQIEVTSDVKELYKLVASVLPTTLKQRQELSVPDTQEDDKVRIKELEALEQLPLYSDEHEGGIKGETALMQINFQRAFGDRLHYLQTGIRTA